MGGGHLGIVFGTVIGTAFGTVFGIVFGTAFGTVLRVLVKRPKNIKGTSKVKLIRSKGQINKHKGDDLLDQMSN